MKNAKIKKKSKVVGLAPEADPTIVSYNATAVKIHNAM
jgi:hypothetical protein